MKYVTNQSHLDLPNDSQRSHAMKIASNQLIKLAEENKIPVFVAYYDPKKGYQYNGLFPEEIDSLDVTSQYNRFYEFLKVCVGFNKEDLTPVVRRKTKK